MKNIFLFLLLFLCSSAFSQIDTENKIDNEMQAYFANFMDINIDSLKNLKIDSVVDINTNYLFKRKLDFSLTEIIFSVSVKYKNNNTFNYLDYNLHFFSNKDSTFGLLVYKEDVEQLNQYFYNSILNNYINLHNELYKSNYLQEDFFLEHTLNISYGYSCGFEGNLDEIPRFNNSFFNNIDNLPEFRKWLKSFNPELQTYAVDALKYLDKNTDFELSDYDRYLIKHIKKRNSKINTCNGCVHGIYKRAFGF